MNLGENLPKNLVLIGFMGCGKSTIGRHLEKLLGYPLVDTDQLIEMKAGMPITQIFADRGEHYFRQLEAAVLQELTAPHTPRRIVSTGGGLINRKVNRRLIKKLGYVIWLKAPVEEILRRTARNHDRPLLKTANPRKKISELLSLREPLYAECADLSLETSDLDAEEIACGILESARYHFANGA
ncbi:MAG: shikimate kinase [Verrucomicrobiales bacterium]